MHHSFHVVAFSLGLLITPGLVVAEEDTVSETEAVDVTEADSEEYTERFDYLVREDLFAGFEGDRDALQRGLKTCNDALDKNPKHAEALVWRGAARVYLAGQSFNSGDARKGMELWTTGIKDMDDAIEYEPDNIGVLIPRAAVLLPAARNAPPAMGKPVLKKVRADLERTYARQKDWLDQLGEHPHGELRMGLADVYRLLGESEKSKEQLVAVQQELPGSPYADRATEWLQAPNDQALAHSCIGCHTE